jgi:hypothetical protein
MPINPDAIKNKTKLIQEMVGMDMNPADAENIDKIPVPQPKSKTILS